VARTRALDRVLQWGHYLIPQWYSSIDRIIYWNKLSRPDTIPLQGADLGSWWFDAAKAATIRGANEQAK